MPEEMWGARRLKFNQQFINNNNKALSKCEVLVYIDGDNNNNQAFVSSKWGRLEIKPT
jgi:hypothetical protein